MELNLVCRVGLVVACAVAGGARADELRVPSQYPTIQAAIDAARPTDTVLVADGVYSGPGNFNLSFRGKAITVRSENGPARTTIDARRASGSSVFIFNGREPPEAVVEGFTITGATRSGIQITGARPTIRDCVVVDNWNGIVGGGVNIDTGGGVTMIDCVLDRNLSGQGGGLNVWENAEARLIRCTISNNRTDIIGGGGVMADRDSVLIMESCIVRGNEAVGFAGFSAGVRIARGSKGSLINCLFYRNRAAVGGGAVSFTNDSSGEVINCTIADNEAGSRAGGLMLTSEVGDVVVANTVLWGNLPDQIEHGGGNLSVTYSTIENGWPGTGNLMRDPLFADPRGGDYQLSAGAFAIDAGDNTALPAHITTDLAGNPRFVEDPNTPNTGVPGGVGGSRIVDMGAYEFQTECYADCDGNGTLDFFDFLCFQNRFLAGDPWADCNGDGVLDFFDFLCFQNEFLAGCP